MSETRARRSRLSEAEAAEQALAHVQHLCQTIGPRPVGSEAEAAAARYVKQRLHELGLRHVREQEFEAPRSAWLPYPIAGASALLGIAFWTLLRGSAFGAYLGALGCGFGLWEVYAELSFGWTPLAGLVPRTRSRNIVGSLAPTEGEGRNAIVFAHLDTQRTPLLSRSRTALRMALIAFYLAMALLTLTTLAFVASWFAEFSLPAWTGLPGAAVTLVAVAVMLHSEATPYTEGANDNASAVGVALALAGNFATRPLRNTRLWIVFTGAEETGCHGAAAFLAQEGENLIQAYAIALEGLGIEGPAYSTREGMLRLHRSNSELLRLAQQVARANPSLGLRPAVIRGGCTEAGLAARRGYRSMALVGLDAGNLLPYWHHPGDRFEVIRTEALAAGYAAAVSLIERLDELPVSLKLSGVKPLSERG